ncbi:MAG: hypothetical protein FJW20_11045 [Acidimicrobiia bacterium]|nr:hypothetical protein [Acidimicrobiia bacterium]
MRPTAAAVFLLLASMVIPAAAQPPENHKAQARQLLRDGNHEQALRHAAEANRAMPDDVETYALLSEAYQGLGRMRDAEKAVQWMLDLRPESPLSLASAAELRMALGEAAGAAEFYREAFRRTQREETARRAELLEGAARAYRAMGRVETAELCLKEAERLRKGGI